MAAFSSVWAGGGLGRDDLLTLGQRRSQRLLAHRRLARRNGGQRVRVVGGVVRRDDHRIDLVIGDQGVTVGGDPGPGLGSHRVCRGPVVVGDDRDLGPGHEALQVADVVRTHVAGADDADAHGHERSPLGPEGNASLVTLS